MASQAVVPVFFFLPSLYSAYYFGRRHSTLTACASACVVVLLAYLDPAVFNTRTDSVPDSRWFDISLWGGVLVVTAYAMGTLYDRSQAHLRELKSGYDAMLVILQNLLDHQTASEAGSFRIAAYATSIATVLGLDQQSSEDLRTAALLRNVNEIGISNEILYRAANLSQEELEKRMRKGDAGATVAQLMGGSLRRAIPILVASQHLKATGANPMNSTVEVQILNLAERFETQITLPARSGQLQRMPRQSLPESQPATTIR